MRAALLFCLLSLFMPAADAGVLKVLEKAACLAVGAVMYPVIAPVSLVGQKLVVAACYSAADWRMASYVVQDSCYDWFWLEEICP